MAILLGTLGDDNIDGTEQADVIDGLTGNDTIYGFAGGDVIDGLIGDDRLYANSRTVWADGAVDTVLGGAGDDHIFGGYGDILNGGTGFDLLYLDMSLAGEGQNANFRSLRILEALDLLTLNIGATTLTGFQAVAELIGSEFADRVVVGNRDRIGVIADMGDGDDRLRATGGEDMLAGGDGADLLRGQSGKDVLVGGMGDDRLLGGRSTDTLTGGDGADAFVFAAGDSPAARKRADIVTDFSADEGDRIVLAGIDAVEGGEDDSFSFIGSARFSGTAGELRFVQVGRDVFVSGDTDGDARADFSIMLDRVDGVTASDFAL